MRLTMLSTAKHRAIATITIIALSLFLSLPSLALAQCTSMTIHTGQGFKFCTQCCQGGSCHITCM